LQDLPTVKIYDDKKDGSTWKLKKCGWTTLKEEATSLPYWNILGQFQLGCRGISPGILL